MSDIDRGLSPYRYEERSRYNSYRRAPAQRFDRIAFALRTLGLLIPARTRIAVFRSSHLQVTQGRDLARGPDARWVMVGVPRDASAESIVLALTQIAGVGELPYTLDASLEAALTTARPN